MQSSSSRFTPSPDPALSPPAAAASPLVLPSPAKGTKRKSIGENNVASSAANKAVKREKTAEEKEQKRARNRVSAKASRDRKKEASEAQRDLIAQLQEEITDIRSRDSEQELARLRTLSALQTAKITRLESELGDSKLAVPTLLAEIETLQSKNHQKDLEIERLKTVIAQSGFVDVGPIGSLPTGNLDELDGLTSLAVIEASVAAAARIYSNPESANLTLFGSRSSSSVTALNLGFQPTSSSSQNATDDALLGNSLPANPSLG